MRSADGLRMRASDAIRWAAAELALEDRLDAELLVAHVLGCDRSALLLSRTGCDVELEELKRLVRRRRAGEPLAYITGHREFWSLDFHVTPEVLIPRPDSEAVIEAALAHESASRAPRVLDLGTGSGCLLLALLSERAEGFGVGIDRSEPAIRVARGNAGRLDLASRSAFVVGDWTNAIDGRFDVVLANPPYLCSGESVAGSGAFEPAAALYAGRDGLDAYRAIIPALPAILARRAAAHLEIGFGQADLVADIARRSGFHVTSRADLAGRPRALTLELAVTVCGPGGSA